MKFIKFFFLALFLPFLACEPCEEFTLEVCGGTDGPPKVDLIVLIDASGSMGRAADTISRAATVAIDSSIALCNTDLKVSFFGVDGIFPGTVFDSTHRQVIYQANGIVPLVSDGNPNFPPELGANAIEDLSNHTQWREGACRAIFYISDEELDAGFTASGSPNQGDFVNETNVTNRAISMANANNVTVFTNYILENMRAPQILANYDSLTANTGGFNQVTASMNDVTESLYLDLMPRIVCNACNACELGQLMNDN